MRSPAARFWRIAGWIAACVWIAWCAYYVASPRPPFEFFADLGGYAETIGRMGTMASSPQAALAMIDWQTWVEQPAFVLFPAGTLYSAVPIELVLRDPFASVKLIQILQLSTAFAGTAWLFGLLFRGSPWRWFAAYAYASMPFCTLAVRGEPDFGWVLALIPVALAVNLALARRIGPWAFPLAGLTCAIAGGAFYIEHYVIVGIPLLVLTVILIRNDGIALRPFHLLFAAAAFAIFPAYVVLPTLYGPHPLWFSEGYQRGLHFQDVLSLFSARLGDQLAGVLRENLVSPDVALNASGSFWFAFTAGTLLWSLLIVALVGARSSMRRWWPIAALGFVWTMLAFGLNVPLLGPWLWGAVAAHPLLAALRTPDRFGQFTAILVALGGAYGAMRLCERGGRARTCAVAACAIVVAGYALFNVREHVLAFGVMDEMVPSQHDIDTIARRIDGRTATLAFSKGASLFDPAPYTTVTPTIVAAWDVAARFSGDAAVPLLRRAGVRSIATSPVWTADVEDGMPADMSIPVVASGLAFPLTGAPGSARLFAVAGPREPVTRVDLVCAFGGPAGFEAAASLPIFDDAALVHGGERPCLRTVYAGGDPLDDVLASAPGRWAGRTAFEGPGLPLPSPYAYEIERFTITQPWYRYAFYGDSLLASPFAIDDSAKHSVPLTFSTSRAARYALFARVSGLGALSTLDAGGAYVTAQSRRMRGFRWVVLPLGTLRPGTYVRTIDVTRGPQAVDPLTVDVIAAAPLSAAEQSPRSDAAIVLPGQFTPPSRATSLAMTHVFPKPQAELSARGQGVVFDSRTAIGTFDGESGIRATEPRSRISFVWHGADGLYAVSASAWLAGGDSSLAIVTPRGTISQGYDPGIGPVPTAARGYLFMRHGDRIEALMNTPDLPANRYNTLLEITAIAAGSDPEPSNYDANGETWAFDAKDTLAFLAAAKSNAVLRAQSMPPVSNAPGTSPPIVLVAPEGTSATIAVRPSVFGGRVSARIGATGLLGTVTLRCGGASQSLDMGVASRNAIAATLWVPEARADRCTLTVRWRSFDFGLRGVTFRATGRYAQNWETPQYLSAGSYSWSALRAKAPLLSVDGSVWNAGESRRFSAGRHRLSLPHAIFPFASLVFRRQDSAADTARAMPVLEAAHLDDGFWFAGAGASAARGYPCDLVNTCFDTASYGPVVHAAPPPLALGLAVTAADILTCTALAAIALFRRRRASA
jgi:hypothetical protein